jgi:hypothetical protein
MPYDNIDRFAEIKVTPGPVLLGLMRLLHVTAVQHFQPFHAFNI